MFDIRLLPGFMAVARHKHFGKAAEAVHATQPGISQHIAKLEKQLGFRLFDRTKRTVALTPAGEAFYDQSRHLMAMMARMKAEGLQIAQGLLGHLGLGMQSSVLYSDVPLRIATFKKANEKINIRFEVHPGDYLRRLMDRGELDVAITTLPMPSPEYDTMVVSHQPMGVAVMKSHPLAGRQQITLEDISSEPFIIVPREYDPVGHDMLLSKLRRTCEAPRIAASETPSLNVIARVAVGEGVALIPLGYQRDGHDAVQVIRLEDPDLGAANIYAAVHKDNARPTTRHFINALPKLRPVP
ncbi:LysR family transcriptional regulator [Mesorhizobium australafricanum]|uniref:LysR family transcriptional regulator n=1 Tax=Mesorhizobium australafricanum TaxID=3072311 RepID=A0ABU4WSG7_9HYPH|nr:LysR family transcriptional regulator [Mesorhizobium sp. VK3E]MDX8439005.1 LysR family transcriptional regulator [Mesorhizobium sp. VK3E]